MPNERNRAISVFYEARAAQLEGAIRRNFVGPAATVEDACSHAWHQLLRHPNVTLDNGGFSWLYVVAIRQAYQLSSREQREPASGAPEELPETIMLLNAADFVAERTASVRERMAVLHDLPPRQRQVVFLQGSGYSYHEISAITGDTPRTVERQILRGRRALREAVAA